MADRLIAKITLSDEQMEEIRDIKRQMEKLKRKKGEWIKNEDDWYYHCSVCEENNLLHTDEANALSDYCPNCGADMRKEEQR